jgi:hypothetical protein
MRVLSSISSVQHYLVIVRGLILRGAGLRSLWLPALALSGIAVAVTALAWLRLRLGLDTDSPKRRLQDMWYAWRRKQHPRQAGHRDGRPRGRGVRKPKLTRKPAYADVRVEVRD